MESLPSFVVGARSLSGIRFLACTISFSSSCSPSDGVAR